MPRSESRGTAAQLHAAPEEQRGRGRQADLEAHAEEAAQEDAAASSRKKPASLPPAEAEVEEPVPEQLTFMQKVNAKMATLDPGTKMIIKMINNILGLFFLTLFGGLIFCGLERSNTLALNDEYAQFMVTLQQTLSQSPGGNDMYNLLISNYMQDPTQLVDYWGPTTNTLYLFAFTIVSTIGYGSFAPKTPGGQIFTMFYALIAIPVGGVFLGAVAGTLLELLEWIAYLLNPRIRKAYGEANHEGTGVLDYDEMRVAIQTAQCQEIDPKDFNKVVAEYDPLGTHEIDLKKFTKIFLSVDTEDMQGARGNDRAKACSLLVIGWLLLGMFYFAKSEGWTNVEAMYFSIVTLTTIGFGDYVPSSPSGDDFHFIFCVVGLGLVATLLSSISALASAGGDEAEEEAPAEEAAPAGDAGPSGSRPPSRAPSRTPSRAPSRQPSGITPVRVLSQDGMDNGLRKRSGRIPPTTPGGEEAPASQNPLAAVPGLDWAMNGLGGLTSFFGGGGQQPAGGKPATILE